MTADRFVPRCWVAKLSSGNPQLICRGELPVDSCRRSLILLTKGLSSEHGNTFSVADSHPRG